MRQAEGNQAAAARLLGLTYDQSAITTRSWANSGATGC